MAAIYKALPPFYAALREGSSGPDVALVQTWLDGLRGEWPALPKLKLDGRFGSDTRSAVRIFQLANGLREDGVVGRETWNALYSRFADQNGAGERYPGIVIRKGNRGAVIYFVAGVQNAGPISFTVRSAVLPRSCGQVRRDPVQDDRWQ